ncbi:MBL fold metallo-hydrolase [Sanguibacter massiliensis]|uniref:MBL fold metallo-hydrolase n=1 Tax=Sanguibacter massiliensis TaxID=1973217 RepID=UPI001F5C1F96|nr:MBL fold metallo-hydrolase [Sanguibacter massiliensis]
MPSADASMFRLTTLVAPVLGASCHVLSATGSGPCLVVDAGGGVAPALHAHLVEHDLVPVAVLATHGHLDHVWDGPLVTDDAGIPFVLHEADAHRLADPFGTLDPWGARGPLVQAVAQQGVHVDDTRVPERVMTFAGERTLLVGAGGLLGEDTLGPGVTVEAVHAPGHTEGSTLYVVSAVPDDSSELPRPGRPRTVVTSTVLTGDVLFAGSVGRTDLPGGDGAVMARTLRDVVATLPGDALVLPGHGPATTVGHEMASNPYLARR